jgi:hypothetical protein
VHRAENGIHLKLQRVNPSFQVSGFARAVRQSSKYRPLPIKHWPLPVWSAAGIFRFLRRALQNAELMTEREDLKIQLRSRSKSDVAHANNADDTTTGEN